MSKVGLIGALVAGAVALGGCATEDYVNKHVAVVQDLVTEHGAHLQHLDRTTQEALDRATAAGKLAEGKFDYAMVMSDDSAHFPINGSDLSQDETAKLTDFANRLKTDNKNVYLEIQGYSDSTGD